MPYVRTVRTMLGTTAVQVVWSSRRGSRKIEHIGSAHDEAELEALKAAARQRVAAGQLELDLGLGPGGRGGGPLQISSSRMGTCWDALQRGYGCWGWQSHRRGRGIPRPGAGQDHRARQQAGQRCGSWRRPGSRRRRTRRSSGGCPA